jgi:hypothetical protein
MSRTYRALTTLALSVALAATAATAALATPPTGSTQDISAQRQALYQSELASSLKTGSAGDVNAQREALYQSELAQNLNLGTAGGTQAVEQARAGERAFAASIAQAAAPAEDQNDRLLRGIEAAQAERTQAAVEQARAGERNLVPVVNLPAPQPIPAAPGRDVDVIAIALLGLFGGLVGGAAVVAGAAANRRRHRVVAA